VSPSFADALEAARGGGRGCGHDAKLGLRNLVAIAAIASNMANAALAMATSSF
jgi:hypothetical protein